MGNLPHGSRHHTHEETMTESSPTKRGRPRKHSGNAEKQAVYRRRKQEPERKNLIAEILKRMARILRAGAGYQLAGLSIRKLKLMRKHLNRGLRQERRRD